MHTSGPLQYALLGIGLAFIKFRVSNVDAREDWRHHSHFTNKAFAMICGFGVYEYIAAVGFANKRNVLKSKPEWQDGSETLIYISALLLQAYLSSRDILT